ncbi:unnamed protein product, partial [Polarella glacialis]
MAPRIRALTLFNEGYEAGFLCSAVNACYCERHGYSLTPLVFTESEMHVLCDGRHFAWAKVALLRWLLTPDLASKDLMSSVAQSLLNSKLSASEVEDLQSADWLVWLDADLMVLNHSKSLEAFPGLDTKDTIVGEDMADLDWLNTGFMMCRAQSPWICALWDRVWCHRDPAFHKGEFWDQSALCGCLADSGEFCPDVVGGKKTGAPSPDTPWYSWQGGLRIKQTEHLLVLDAGGTQSNNPRFARFAFHAAGMKDKPRCCRAVVEAGAVRGLQALDAARARCERPAGTTLAWQPAFEALSSATAMPSPPWRWPCQSRQTWLTERPISRIEQQWSRLEPALCSRIEVPPPWSLEALSELSELSELSGEVQVEMFDRAPPRPGDPPPASKPFGSSVRARLWEAARYAAGIPPGSHIALREMDSARLWRTFWRPWAPGAKFQPKLQLAWPAGSGIAKAGGIGRMPPEACVELAPPGSELRLHKPEAGEAGFL